ncbi:MAG: PIG-L family deacetylase [Hyphomonadaceae bacterium]|nr:PIG-L family deacetylase [Hyphomonadaceae bacterium]
MRAVDLVHPGAELSVLCIGAHADDLEIGAGGTILTWLASGASLSIHWCVASAPAERAGEAQASAEAFLAGAKRVSMAFGDLKDSYFPYQGERAKAWIEAQKQSMRPDIVLTHRGDDAHQDHRLMSELTWNAFRDSLVLEYEIPKWDGDLWRPNMYVSLAEPTLAKKIELLEKHFGSQRSKDWFDAETFRGLARLRGVECRSRYAEAFWARKVLLR